MSGVAIRELRVITMCAEIARALRVVEGKIRIAEIAVQRRPQRIVIVDDG